MLQSRTQKSLYMRTLAPGVNLALWPIKAWGLAQDEQDEFAHMPTGYLCTGHLLTAMALGFASIIIGMSLFIAGFVSLSTVVGVMILLHLGTGLSLRHWVSKRCHATTYDYVRENLDLIP